MPPLSSILFTIGTALGLGVLLFVRQAGFFTHQLIGLVLLVGLVFAAGNLGWAWWTGDVERVSGEAWWHVAPRLLFWGSLGVAGVLVFPRTAEVTGLIGALTVVAALRVAASAFVVDPRSGPTVLMGGFALVVLWDLVRVLLPTAAAVVTLQAPVEGEWLVLQGGPSRLESHHLAAYNQVHAVDLLRLRDGGIFTGSEGIDMVHAWDEPLYAPGDGTVVVASDGMADSDGVNFVTEKTDAAGNHVVIELESGHFVLLAHMKQGSLLVAAGDRVTVGQPIGRVGNSGNTTLSHLHLQVQTHADLWDPDNRSVPFAIGEGSRALRRNDRVKGR